MDWHQGFSIGADIRNPNKGYLDVPSVLPGAVDDVLGPPSADLGEVLAAVAADRAADFVSLRQGADVDIDVGIFIVVSLRGGARLGGRRSCCRGRLPGFGAGDAGRV